MTTATVATLVNNAMYKSLYDRQYYPTISGPDSQTGLQLLREIMDECRDVVPFVQRLVTTTQDQLTNTDFVGVQVINYYLSTNVKYPLYWRNIRVYNDDSLIQNLQAPPKYYWFDELTQTINVYPKPNNIGSGWNFEIFGFMALTALTLQTELPASMPVFLKSYLEYELAMRLCNEYGVEWSPQKEAIRAKLYKQALIKRNIDLTPDYEPAFKTGNVDAPWPWLWSISGGH